MTDVPSRFVSLAVILVAAAALVAGCGKKDDPVAKAEKKDAAKGIPAPGIAETKAIEPEVTQRTNALVDWYLSDVAKL